MAPDNARERLLDLLDEKAFDPVIEASQKDVAKGKRERLAELQETTRSTKRSYHEKYTTAQKVRDNFRDDLSSQAARKVQRELRDLGLPTLQDVKEEFEDLARKLDV